MTSGSSHCYIRGLATTRISAVVAVVVPLVGCCVDDCWQSLRGATPRSGYYGTKLQRLSLGYNRPEYYLRQLVE